MSSLKKSLTATFIAVGLASISVQARAMDAVEQFIQVSYQSASNLCQSGIPYACQQLPNFELSLQMNTEIRNRCQRGNQQACSVYRQNQFDARQRMNTILNYRAPQLGGSGGKSAHEIRQETSEIINRGYEENDRIRSEGHADTVRTFAGEQLVTNPDTGKSVVVEGFLDHTWVNSQGDWISTDNPLLNPNIGTDFNDPFKYYGN